MSKLHRIIPPLSIEAQARFWSYVDIRGPEECWPWIGWRNPNGYGQFSYQGQSYGAHRIAFFLTHGPIPAGALILHSCDNPPCCAPHDLASGTTADNAWDAVHKGRWATGVRHGAYTHPEQWQRGNQHWTHTHPEKLVRGEHHGMGKLTEAKVHAIRQLLARGVIYREIALQHNVAVVTISRLARGLTWKHVLPTPEVGRG
jgi:hypothetical protein